MGNTKHGTTRTMLGLSAQTSSHSPFLLCLALERAMQYIAPANIATTMSTTNTSKRIPLILFSTAFQTLGRKPCETRQKRKPCKTRQKTLVFLVVYFTLIF